MKDYDNDVDYFGIDAVAKVLEQSGLNGFHIQKANSNTGTPPIYALVEKNTAGIIKGFKDWAKIYTMANPKSDMIFFMSVFNDEQKNENPRKNNMKFSFAFNYPHEEKEIGVISGLPQPQYQQPGSNGSGLTLEAISGLIDGKLAALADKQREDKLLNALEDLSERIEDLENGNSEQMQAVPYWWNSFNENFINRGQKPTALADDKSQTTTKKAATTDKAERLKNINTAVPRLFRCDPCLDQHLLKLADVAEKEPEQFKQFLTLLDSL